jgi:hypothetical protein
MDGGWTHMHAAFGGRANIKADQSSAMNTNPARAPLVATSSEDAANMMMSEGGPLHAREPEGNSASACCSWADLRTTVNQHPLSTLAVAFSVGFLAGLSTRH